MIEYLQKINIFDSVINQDLCTGCGACLYRAQSNEWKMDWNKEGFLVPILKNGESQMNETNINVCPFKPYPANEVRTEDELANLFLKDAPNYHSKVGRYYNTYAGYSEKYRLTSSSGGLATYILNELFEQQIIDAVITVAEGEGKHYEYNLIKRKEDLLATSKTKYYPVTMAKALNELINFDGKVAVVGIGCFIKAIRLLQYYNPELCNKIIFTVGIICGGLKSKFFGEYLAAKTGIINNEFTKPQFRIKDYASTAGDYSFGCIDNKGSERQVKMRTVGDMWGTGMFKCNACDFCDDVTTELADISLGDAWLPPFNQDGKGTNVIVTRSKLAEELINKGIQSKKLEANELPFETFQASQQGSYNHRHKALKYRIQKVEKQGTVIPPKRHIQENISLDFKLVQQCRREVRKNSLLFWNAKPNANLFEVKMRQSLWRLEYATKIYHFKQSLLKNLFNKS